MGSRDGGRPSGKREENVLDVLQLLVSGLANGCVYGLIALGFVLIYKATEQVNFAQGDMMMLGAYITLGFHNAQFMGLPFWLSVPMAVVLMGVFGYLLDMFVLRRMFGQPQIAVVILTIALGFVLRFFAGLTVPEVAEVVGVSVPTVERRWRVARGKVAPNCRS